MDNDGDDAPAKLASATTPTTPSPLAEEAPPEIDQGVSSSNGNETVTKKKRKSKRVSTPSSLHEEKAVIDDAATATASASAMVTSVDDNQNGTTEKEKEKKKKGTKKRASTEGKRASGTKRGTSGTFNAEQIAALVTDSGVVVSPQVELNDKPCTLDEPTTTTVTAKESSQSEKPQTVAPPLTDPEPTMPDPSPPAADADAADAHDTTTTTTTTKATEPSVEPTPDPVVIKPAPLILVSEQPTPPTEAASGETPEGVAHRIFKGDMTPRKDIAPYLGKEKPFNMEVLVQFVKLFDFKSKPLDQAVRLFCEKFPLLAEAQIVARILDQFAARYHEQNPKAFASAETVHTIVTSMMLLNTDLHSGAVEKKMTVSDFIKNTYVALEEDERPKESVLKEIFNSVKHSEIPLSEDPETPLARSRSSVYSFFFQGSSRQVSSASSRNSVASSVDMPYSLDVQQVLCEGILLRKHVMETPDKKATSRQWKPFEVVLSHNGLHLYKVDTTRKIPRERRHLEDILVRHGLASIIRSHPERINLFSLQTHTGSLMYYECSDEASVFKWVHLINWVAATTSAPPLPAAIGSKAVFRRPVMPTSVTALDAVAQLASHRKQIEETDKKIFTHIECQQELLQQHTGRGSKALEAMSNWDKEMFFLNGERQKYEAYVHAILSGPTGEDVKPGNDVAPLVSSSTIKAVEGDNETTATPLADSG